MGQHSVGQYSPSWALGEYWPTNIPTQWMTS